MKAAVLRRHRVPASLALLAVAVTCWNWPLLSGLLPDFMDVVAQLYPYRQEAARQLAAGHAPLWNPHLFGGVPLAANPQVAAWYPPNLVFYLWPGPVGFGVVVIAHYVIAAWGSFFAARRLGTGWAAALLAGLLFAFGSMLVSRLALNPHLYSAAWMPWLLWACEGVARAPARSRVRWSVAFGLIAGLQFLAGSPQLSYYSAIMAGLYLVVRCVSARRWGALAVAVPVGLGVAGLVAAVQLLPTLEFLGETARGSIAIDRLRDQALGGGFRWRALVGFTGPEIEDTDSINAIGIGALLLVPMAFTLRRRRGAAIGLAAVGVAGYLLSLADLVGLWAAILPLFDRFHAPRRALIWWSVAGPLLAALGFHRLLVILRARRAPGWAGPVAFVALLAPTLLMLPRLERVFADPVRFTARPELLASLGSDRYITLDPTFAYAYDSRRYDYGESLMANLAPQLGVYDLNGYDPLVPGRMARARDAALGRSGILYPSHGVFWTDPNSPLLRWMNVQYLVGRWDLYEPSRLIPGTSIDHGRLAESLDLVLDHPRWPLFRFREDRPLAWAAARTVEHPEPLLAALRANDPFAVAFSEPPFTTQRWDPAAVAAAYRSDGGVRVEVDHAIQNSAAFVCVAVAWSDHWAAIADDGSYLELVPVNGTITGVVSPAESGGFDLVYRPVSFVRGAMLSLAGLLAAVALVLWERRRYSSSSTVTNNA